MLWVVFVLLVLFAVPAIFISQGNRNALMDAMAMHERLQRTDPEDPLAKLGPTEFQRAFERAARSRGKPMMKGMGFGLLVGFFAGIVLGFMISYISDDAENFMPVFGLVFIGCVVFGAWRGASKRLSVFDEIRRQLHID